MRIVQVLAALLAIVSAPTSAQTPVDRGPSSALVRTSTSPVRTAAPPAPLFRARLTKDDVDAWLDGFVPYAIDEGDIAGAVIVVVKDGKVLTERGFGYADLKTQKRVDPAATLFRPGSISKLFTWTAVMQLVQAGKLDFDRDINDYLDFRIPPAFGRPITLRNLLTHTAGFEEAAKYLIVFDPKQNVSLARALKRWTPDRVYAPGTVPAYSNYGASLAGYIVQRVSGEPFDDYIRRHVFAPIGMTRSTFAQPLPPSLAPLMAQGYRRASASPDGFEYVPLAPAGALSTTGDDMARFMIAHLTGGGPLLSPRTTALMHSPANTPIAGLPSMGLGFYREDREGLAIAGHGGDLENFHSDLHLFLDQNVGLFMSFNSAGKNASAHTVRQRLFEQFTQRYLAVATAPLPTVASARLHGQAMAGRYVSSRASTSNYQRFGSLIGNTEVALRGDDTITVSTILNAAGVPKRWREIAPWQWVEVGGTDRLGAAADNGRVTRFAPASFAPIFVFLPAPASLNGGWIMPLAYFSLAITVLTAISWPVVALVRRRYGHAVSLSGPPLRLHQVSRATAWALSIGFIGWFMLFAALGSSAHSLDGSFDGRIRMLQAALAIGVVGTAVTVANAFDRMRRSGRRSFGAFWDVLLAVCAAFLVWPAFDGRLLAPSLNF